jgi:hypothetical protein
MNALILMMALLALVYLSSLIRRGRSGRVLGLAAGSEWLILGLVLGASGLGVVDRALQAEVEPVLYVAVGWVSLVIGVDYGVVRGRRLRLGRIVAGLTIGALTIAAVAGSAYWLTPLVGLELDGGDRWVLAIGLGAVASETACDTVRWVSARHGAVGRLSLLLDGLAQAKDAICIVAAGAAICLHPSFDLARRLPHGGPTLLAVVVAIGVLIGVMATMMLSREARVEQTWGLLVGIVLLAAGTTAMLRLPVITMLFTIGLVVGVASRHRERIATFVEPTRSGALLPVLILAGARLDPHLLVTRGLLVGGVLAARALVLFLAGLVLAPVGRAGGAALLLGPAMLPAGPLSITIGLGFALVFPGDIGDTVLAAAAVVTVSGELFGPVALRRVLRRVGEIGGEPAPAKEAA